MKAFLLAGGFGTRLKPLTDDIPKCLIPINGIPLLSYWFKLFEENNVTEVLINLHHLQKKVIEFCSEYNGKVKIKLVYESELLGSAGTILANKDFIENEDSFLILYADNLTNVNLIELIEFNNIYEFPLTVGLFHSKNPSNCGIVGRKNLFNFFDSKQTKFPYDFANDVMSKMIGQMDGKILDCYIRDIGTHENLKIANEEVKRFFNFDY
jgi:mannose-1-phosphate guanylyltransferase